LSTKNKKSNGRNYPAGSNLSSTSGANVNELLQTKNKKLGIKNHPAGSGSSSAIGPGSLAPDFLLKTTPDQAVSLKEFRNRPVVLAFYPADFSPVCGSEMALFNEVLPEFNRHNAQVLGVSVDNIWSHLAFAREQNLGFPLLSDFHPKGAMAQDYGVYREQDGVTERALFVIDGAGTVKWSYVSPIGVNPGVNGVLSALESLEDNNSRLTPSEGR